MPGPKKEWHEDETGEYIEKNYEFLEKLWKEERKWGEVKDPVTLRQYLVTQTSEDNLRAALAMEQIVIPSGVRIMLVDLESAKTIVHGAAINPGTEDFYALVLPPALRREAGSPPKKKNNHTEVQAWRGAYYHAFSDGYGM